MFVLAAPHAALQVFSLHSTGTQQVTRDQIVSQQSHLSAIRVNLTVRFNFFDVKSGVPFLEFTEQSLIYQWVISTSELDCFSVEMSCTHTYSAK